MTAWTMFSWRRLWSGGGGEGGEDARAQFPADTRQLVYNVFVYFSRRPGRSTKTALAKTARATMIPPDIVEDISVLPMCYRALSSKFDTIERHDSRRGAVLSVTLSTIITRHKLQYVSYTYRDASHFGAGGATANAPQDYTVFGRRFRCQVRSAADACLYANCPECTAYFRRATTRIHQHTLIHMKPTGEFRHEASGNSQRRRLTICTIAGFRGRSRALFEIRIRDMFENAI
ncbi:hypothetical protein EVAR_23883_1 [Eumeta japonica]|uniref:Uncharacterized protein n=1 Tax=Eumeta variegata TaxID=151549 RepID=A0A4C1V4P3_EUMVA|nr:hypothetical protein EVAR_23883_1 [Eumeta japonica]